MVVKQRYVEMIKKNKVFFNYYFQLKDNTNLKLVDIYTQAMFKLLQEEYPIDELMVIYYNYRLASFECSEQLYEHQELLQIFNHVKNMSLEKGIDYLKQHLKSYFILKIEDQMKINGLILIQSHHSIPLDEIKEITRELNINTIESKAMYEDLFYQIIDHINGCIYISDIDTDEILYANKALLKEFECTSNLEGELCYKVLQKGQSKRCSFCPVNQLIKPENKNKIIEWEEVNTQNQKVYKNFDSVINWGDRGLVHLQQSIDITDIKKLSHDASTDELTGVLNRRAGKIKMAQLIEKAKEENKILSVMLYDIEELKKTNEKYGQLESDHKIKYVSEGVKMVTTSQDILFRLGSDVFVNVFYDCNEEQASKKVKQAQEYLEIVSNTEKFPYLLNYCYGIVEIKPEDNMDIEDILVNVDEKMYEQKRFIHIQAAQKEHDNKKDCISELLEFDYKQTDLYEALISSTDDYIFVSDMKSGVFKYSKAMVEEFDLPSQLVENAAVVWGQRIHPLDQLSFLESNQEILDGRCDYHDVEYRALNKNNQWVWLRCRGKVIKNENGEPIIFAGIISNLERKNKVDHLTGLYNIYQLEEEIKNHIANHTNERLSLLVLNLDSFRHINQLYNRRFGDEVLKITSQKICELIPENIGIYKLDSDEFALLLKNYDDTQIDALYTKVSCAFNGPQEHLGQKYHCSLSAGCASYPNDTDVYSNLLKYAGYALESSKTKGKAKITFFSQDVVISKMRKLDLLNQLRESIADNFKGFELHFQGIVDAKTYQFIGAEALTRFYCEKYGRMSPMEFIPLLEESGLIIPVGNWVLQEAIKYCKMFMEINPNFRVSINFSYIQANQPDFAQVISDTLKQAQLSSEHIILEFTETHLASNQSNKMIELLSEDKFKIAMDDFGTEYSSLGMLKTRPVDIVKIDKIFLKDIKNSHFDATFIRFVVELCHDVGIEVCIEGVEDQEELSILSPMGLDYIQGFLFAKPIQGEQLLEVLKEKIS